MVDGTRTHRGAAMLAAMLDMDRCVVVEVFDELLAEVERSATAVLTSAMAKARTLLETERARHLAGIDARVAELRGASQPKAPAAPTPRRPAKRKAARATPGAAAGLAPRTPGKRRSPAEMQELGDKILVAGLALAMASRASGSDGTFSADDVAAILAMRPLDLQQPRLILMDRRLLALSSGEKRTARYALTRTGEKRAQTLRGASAPTDAPPVPRPDAPPTAPPGTVRTTPAAVKAAKAKRGAPPAQQELALPAEAAPADGRRYVVRRRSKAAPEAATPPAQDTAAA